MGPQVGWGRSGNERQSKAPTLARQFLDRFRTDTRKPTLAMIGHLVSPTRQLEDGRTRGPRTRSGQSWPSPTFPLNYLRKLAAREQSELVQT